MDYPVLNTDGWVEEGGKVADVVRSQVKSSPITEGLERTKYTCTPEAVQIKAPRLTIYPVTAEEVSTREHEQWASGGICRG